MDLRAEVGMPPMVHNRELPLGAEVGMTPLPCSLVAGCHNINTWKIYTHIHTYISIYIYIYTLSGTIYIIRYNQYTLPWTSSLRRPFVKTMASPLSLWLAPKHHAACICRQRGIKSCILIFLCFMYYFTYCLWISPWGPIQPYWFNNIIIWLLIFYWLQSASK